MDNEQRLRILNNQKHSIEYDLARNQYEVECYSEIGELPNYAQENLTHLEIEVDFLQKKLDWFNLKIEELTAIIENTN